MVDKIYALEILSILYGYSGVANSLKTLSLKNHIICHKTGKIIVG